MGESAARRPRDNAAPSPPHPSHLPSRDLLLHHWRVGNFSISLHFPNLYFTVFTVFLQNECTLFNELTV